MRRTSCLLLLLSLPAPALAQSQISGRNDDRAAPGTYPLEELRAFLAEPGVHDPYVPDAPLGLPRDLSAHVPADNPLTRAKVELGRQLYFDKRLSLDGTVSCATCHDPARGWTDCAPVSTGIGGQLGGRSAPIVTNRLLGSSMFWDGRAASLEEQSLGPIANPVEMGFDVEGAVQRLAGIEGYALQFRAVFGGEPTGQRLAWALAAFERTILSGGNKNDHYEAALPFFDYEVDGSEDAEFLERMDTLLRNEEQHRMTLAAERGRELFFGKAACSQCHVGADLTDEDFHNLGIGFADGAFADTGRVQHTGVEADTGKFKTPSLRNVALTAPYMHDGSLATLMDVVRHYDKGGHPNPYLSEKVFPLKLTEQEMQDVAIFMEEALTGPVTEVEVPRLP